MVDGKRHPLDPEPSAAGRIVLEHGRGRKLERDEAPPGGTAYVSHFSTCPDAKTWRPGGENRKAAPGGASRPSSTPRPSRAPTAVEFVDAIRNTKFLIQTGEDPMLTATSMLHAATQVLVEGGKTVAQVQELVARGVR